VNLYRERAWVELILAYPVGPTWDLNHRKVCGDQTVDREGWWRGGAWLVWVETVLRLVCFGI